MEKTNKKTIVKNTKSNVALATKGVSIVPSRGRAFEGVVTKKFPTRVVVEFERVVKVHKFERFYKKKTRLHARLPQGMDVEVGDYIRVMECRPLSKIIHSIVVAKIKSAETKNNGEDTK